MVLMSGVWGAQPPSRYGISRRYNHLYHVQHCHNHFYHYHVYVTISCRQHASSDHVHRQAGYCCISTAPAILTAMHGRCWPLRILCCVMPTHVQAMWCALSFLIHFGRFASFVPVSYTLVSM